MKVKKEVIIFIMVSVLLFTLLLPLAKSQEVSTLATVAVKPAYDLDIGIEILDDKISSKENLNVLINLTKTNLISISEEISVDLNYEIAKKGKKREIIESGFLETISITNNKTETVEIPVPSDLKGRHILKIIASNPQSNPVENSETFVVRKKTRFLTPSSFQGLINLLSLFKK